MIIVTTVIDTGSNHLTLKGLREFVEAAERKDISDDTYVFKIDVYDDNRATYVSNLRFTKKVEEPITTPQDSIV